MALKEWGRFISERELLETSRENLYPECSAINWGSGRLCDLKSAQDQELSSLLSSSMSATEDGVIINITMRLKTKVLEICVKGLLKLYIMCQLSCGTFSFCFLVCSSSSIPIAHHVPFPQGGQWLMRSSPDRYILQVLPYLNQAQNTLPNCYSVMGGTK